MEEVPGQALTVTLNVLLNIPIVQKSLCNHLTMMDLASLHAATRFTPSTYEHSKEFLLRENRTRTET